MNSVNQLHIFLIFSEIFPYLPRIFSQPPAESADLQVIESDFARLEAETTSAEEASKKEQHETSGKAPSGFHFWDGLEYVFMGLKWV